MTRAEDYLAAAEKLLTELVPGARGTWPRACSWLIRLALETALAPTATELRHLHDEVAVLITGLRSANRA